MRKYVGGFAPPMPKSTHLNPPLPIGPTIQPIIKPHVMSPHQSKIATEKMKLIFLIVLLIATLILAEETKTMSTLLDGDVLSVTKTEQVPTEAKPESASNSPPGPYQPVFGGAATQEADGTEIFLAGSLSTDSDVITQNGIVQEGQVDENEGEVLEDDENTLSNVAVSSAEDTLEDTEDYRHTLSAALNTARLLEVDAPETLSESSEPATLEDAEMLEEREAIVEEQ